jgi:flagellar biosynthesis/type III secretory pathway protein FliH
MSAVIKAGAADAKLFRIRPLLDGRPPAEPPPAPEQVVSVEVLGLRRQLDTASRELGQQQAEIERLRGDVTRAFHEGEAEGRKAGLKAGDQRRADYLTLLESGVDRAICDFASRLSSLEGLAAAMSREALRKMLDDADGRLDLVASLIRRQLSQIEAQSVLRVSVSQEDFPSEDELRTLATAIGADSVDLRAATELEAGECRIRLTLGTLDVGIGQQWERLGATLEALEGAP